MGDVQRIGRNARNHTYHHHLKTEFLDENFRSSILWETVFRPDILLNSPIPHLLFSDVVHCLAQLSSQTAAAGNSSPALCFLAQATHVSISCCPHLNGQFEEISYFGETDTA